jgi:hypothetical protein
LNERWIFAEYFTFFLGLATLLSAACTLLESLAGFAIAFQRSLLHMTLLVHLVALSQSNDRAKNAMLIGLAVFFAFFFTIECMALTQRFAILNVGSQQVEILWSERLRAAAIMCCFLLCCIFVMWTGATQRGMHFRTFLYVTALGGVAHVNVMAYGLSSLIESEKLFSWAPPMAIFRIDSWVVAALTFLFHRTRPRLVIPLIEGDGSEAVGAVIEAEENAVEFAITQDSE